MATYTLKESHREMVVYASTREELESITADAEYIKRGIDISTGKEYLLFPGTDSWEELH